MYTRDLPAAGAARPRAASPPRCARGRARRCACSTCRCSARGHSRRCSHQWRPDAVGFSLNYLANVPEVIDLAQAARAPLPRRAASSSGGHSASFTARGDPRPRRRRDRLRASGARARRIAPRVLEAAATGDRRCDTLPGVVTARRRRPAAALLPTSTSTCRRATCCQRRRKYFIGVLDPCASIEFTRGCPWDCSFCSAWTFYGRSYRKSSPAAIGEDLARIREPGVFIVDDVAFIHAEHGFAIGREIEKRGIRKRYYLETRVRRAAAATRRCSRAGRRLGLSYMFLGIEAIDEDGLQASPQARERSSKNLAALEYRALPRHHGRDQHHRRPRLGRGAASRSSASGPRRCRRS